MNFLFLKSASKYLGLYLIFSERAVFVAIVANIIAAICICGQKEVE